MGAEGVIALRGDDKQVAGTRNGALSAHRVQLGRSEYGAVPHRHNNSPELFFMLDGTLDVLDVLVGSEILPPSRSPAISAAQSRARIRPFARTIRAITHLPAPSA